MGTTVGRVALSSIRRHVYDLTDCSSINDRCECSDGQKKCEESVAPHDIRRSSITAWLDQGHDPQLISDRCDLSVDTMETHYDVRTPAQKRELRRDAFNM